MEVIVKQKSSISPSEKVIVNASQVHFNDESYPVVRVRDVQERRLYDVVSVQGKVHSVGQSHTMENGSEKQNVAVVDASGSGRVSVWEDAVGTVMVGKSYLFKMFMVREFSGRRYLTMCKSSVSTIEEIGDIVNVTDVSSEDALTCDKVLKNAEIIAIPEFVRKRVCRRCASGVMPGEGDPPTSGNCLNCGMVQKYELCCEKVYAKLMFAAEGEEDLVLIAGADILKRLVGADVSELALITAPKVAKVVYSRSGVITAVEFDHCDSGDVSHSLEVNSVNKTVTVPTQDKCLAVVSQELFDGDW